MRFFLAILTALSLTWSSATLSRPTSGALCAAGEERALRARGGDEGRGGPRLYAQARYLDPNTGRFLSLDPVAGALDDPMSTQGFIYARANPTRFTDPDGRQDIGTLFVGATMSRKSQECGPNGSAHGCASAKAGENIFFGATVGAALSAPCLLAPEACAVGLGAGLLTSGAPSFAIGEQAAYSTVACFSDDVVAMTDDELASCQMLAGGLLASAPEMAFGGFEGAIATRRLMARFAAAGTRSEAEAAALAVGITTWTVPREATAAAGMPPEVAAFMARARAMNASAVEARGLQPSPSIAASARGQLSGAEYEARLAAAQAGDRQARGELEAAEALLSEGENVHFQTPKGKRGPNTADFRVGGTPGTGEGGRAVDVYTPKVPEALTVYSGVASKNNQAPEIIVNLRGSGLTSKDVGGPEGVMEGARQILEPQGKELKITTVRILE